MQVGVAAEYRVVLHPRKKTVPVFAVATVKQNKNTDTRPKTVDRVVLARGQNNPQTELTAK